MYVVQYIYIYICTCVSMRSREEVEIEMYKNWKKDLRYFSLVGVAFVSSEAQKPKRREGERLINRYIHTCIYTYVTFQMSGVFQLELHH